MKKWPIVFCIVAILAGFGAWYWYSSTYGKPNELIAAEDTLKSIMKAPDTFKIKRAIFDVDKGHPVMLIEYSSQNAMGVPLAGTAKFEYTDGSGRLPSPNATSPTDKALRSIRLEEMKAINAGTRKVEPFDYCKLEKISLPGDKLGAQKQQILASIYSAKLINENASKPFPPRPRIGGVIKSVGNGGDIREVEAGIFPRIYAPGKFITWE